MTKNKNTNGKGNDKKEATNKAASKPSVTLEESKAIADKNVADKKIDDAKKIADKKIDDAKKIADKKIDDDKKIADKKIDDAKKIADKAADDKKIADKKIADKAAADAKKIADNKAIADKKIADKATADAKALKNRKAPSADAEVKGKAPEKKNDEDPTAEQCNAFNRLVHSKPLKVEQICDLAMEEFGDYEKIRGLNFKEIAFKIGSVRLPVEGFYMGN